MMQYVVCAVLTACCTSVYAVLAVNSCLWHGEIERDDLTSCSEVMVVFRTRKREMRGEGTHHGQ
jgi:hypothetical protein